MAETEHSIISTKLISIPAPIFIRTNCVVDTIYCKVTTRMSSAHVRYEVFTDLELNPILSETYNQEVNMLTTTPRRDPSGVEDVPFSMSMG